MIFTWSHPPYLVEIVHAFEIRSVRLSSTRLSGRSRNMMVRNETVTFRCELVNLIQKEKKIHLILVVITWIRREVVVLWE